MAHSPQNKADYAARVDRFAELLSQDLDMKVIAERMGMSKSASFGFLHRLRAKIGWQAA